MKKILIIITAAVGLMVIGAGATYAAVAALPNPNNYPTGISGCYQAGTGSRPAQLYYAGVNGDSVKCPRGELPISWPGPAAITAGAAGLDVQVVGVTGSGIAVTAQCPADHPYALGGGYNANLVDGTVITRAAPGEPSGTGTTGDYVVSSNNTVAVYVICAK